MIGTSLGPYKIIEQLGAGGMGEVYLGEDTRLGRKVAIKVLPEEYASDPERLARFEQEARAAAALNHPHIAVVHDIGTEGDIHFMVQEYLEGQSLRERLEKGALPLDKALDLAAEVGEALIAAHKAGIIHRDLKPDNIFITEEGHAKVLDFGLAKLTEMAAPTGSSASMSPTMLGTVAGQVMGTAGYMAPEQINGEEIDHRADLFAFGCVLYGMVAGKQAFAGRNVMQTLDLILAEAPQPIGEIKADLPLKLQWILDKALAKEPAKRYQTAGDLVVDLRTLGADVESGTAIPVTGEAPTSTIAVETSRGIPWKVGVPVAIGTLLIGVLGTWWATLPVPQPLKRFAIVLPEGATFAPGGNVVAISPDGNTLVYVATGSGGQQLYLRPMDRVGAATPIPGTEDASHPFFSADGEWVGFGAGNNLKKVSLAGGDPFDLCEGCVPSSFYGDWGPLGDTIVFAQGGSLWQIPSVGGEPELLAEPDPEKDEGYYNRPEILPDGNALLFEIRRGGALSGNPSIAVLSLETTEVQIVAEEGTDPMYAESGHVIYARGDALFGVTFDPGSLSVTGQPTPVVQGVSVYGGGAAQFGISRDGTLVYVPGSAGGGRALAWVDRQGTSQPVSDQLRLYAAPRLSPDGRRVAVEADSDIWILEIEQNTLNRLTTEGTNRYPIWTPDGSRVTFATIRDGADGLFQKSADFSEEARELLPGENLRNRPGSWTPDGGSLLFTENHPDTGRNILVLPVDDDGAPGTPSSFAGTSFNETSPMLSHDGDWLAYTSDLSGQNEVYVEPFPGGGRRVQVSNEGGVQPLWGPDGRELFYRNGNRMIAVSVRTEPSFEVVNRELLFEKASYFGRQVFPQYDITSNGQRFLMVEALNTGGGSLGPRINVVLNWFEELKQRVPTGQ